MSATLLAFQHIACEPGPGALPAFLADVEASAAAALPLARSLFGRWLEHTVGVPGRAVG